MKLLFKVLLLALLATPLEAQPRKTEYVFLVTADGVRPQEVFQGVDPKLVEAGALSKSGVQDLEGFRSRYWSDDPARRREKLMPFFWKELARQGVVLGNRERGSAVVARNRRLVSYPGYAEILNGQPLEGVTGNERVFSPRPTVLEYVRRQFRVPPTRVATYASWEVFSHMTMHSAGSVFCDADTRPDAETLREALEHVKKHRPKMFYLALGDTDEWAHMRRYDKTAESIRFFDDALRELWTLLQSMETYRGKTTLIVTTDHGRGATVDDWVRHGASVPGSDEVWVALIGPDTPPSGDSVSAPAYSQSSIAATILKLYGLDYRDFNPRAGSPIAVAFGARRVPATAALKATPVEPDASSAQH